MSVPCAHVPRESDEVACRRLVGIGLLDRNHETTVVEGTLYVPVIGADAIPDNLTVVDYKPPVRETQTTPADLLGFGPSYERLGDIAILDEDDPDRAREIADATVASDLRAETVVNRASKIKGELRVRDWNMLVGDSTEMVHREYGHEFRLDIDTVYFSPRLATERHRVAEAVQEGEHVFDMFADAGPSVVPAATAGAEVVTCGLNEAVVAFLWENAARNDVADRLTVIHGDVHEVATDYGGWADRFIMNFPRSASDFLDTAVRLASDDCVIHLYDIQHRDDPFGPRLTAVRAAAEPAYEVEVVNEYVVRSYAPHKYSVYLDARLTKRA